MRGAVQVQRAPAFRQLMHLNVLRQGGDPIMQTDQVGRKEKKRQTVTPKRPTRSSARKSNHQIAGRKKMEVE